MTGNAAQNSNSSQFYITLAAAPQCDGKHVVIGEVVDGLGIVARIGAACCCLPVLFFRKLHYASLGLLAKAHQM